MPLLQDSDEILRATNRLTRRALVTWSAMNNLHLHHVLVAVDDLEPARQFYTDVLEMQEIDRPTFDYPGI